MKISNSKKELAKIISKNGGWRDGAEWAAMDKTDGNCNSNSIGFFSGKYRPECYGSIKMWRCRHIHTVFMGYEKSIICEKIIGNWHRSCLSRAEYFHLYPVPDADGWIEWNGGDIDIDDMQLVDYRMDSTPAGKHLTAPSMSLVWGKLGKPWDIIAYRQHKQEQVKPEFCESVTRSIREPESKPTIEQLATDYRNKLDYADRKQDEADKAKIESDAALSELEKAIAAVGFAITPIGAAVKEPELVITDLFDLNAGDIILVGDSDTPDDNKTMPAGEYEILSVDVDSGVGVRNRGVIYYPHLEARGWRFIRRP